MRIESIKPGRRDKTKLIIYFTDGSFAETSAEDSYMLKAGDELSCDKVRELSEKYRLHRAKKSAANSLSHRNMSRYELVNKLRNRGYSETESDDAVLWLEKMGIVDDEKYAASCAEYYINRGYGKLRIKEELHRRGISRETAEEILCTLPEAADEIDRLIQKKLRGQSLDPDKKKRLVSMLLRRGFKYDEIRAAFMRFALDTEDML